MSDTNNKPAEPLIRNISDTARWVAVYRARETERPDAVFRDPFARRLAGERGEQIAQWKPLGTDNGWPLVTRTHVIDKMVEQQVQGGVDTVINMAAGLDTRPYRLKLPETLRWIEIDLPEILTYKEGILREEKPVCRLERIRLDLSNSEARRELFAKLGGESRRALLITEGLVIYLTREQVAGLAADLAGPPSFQSWIVEIASPPLLRMLSRNMKAELKKTAPFQFGPEEGVQFFAPYGWQATEVQSLVKNAKKLKRLPVFMKLFTWLPENEESRRKRPWSGICLLQRKRV